ncbi:MAG: hypothetical protein AAF721_36665 [Myxococcota bacterium]
MLRPKLSSAMAGVCVLWTASACEAGDANSLDTEGEGDASAESSGDDTALDFDLRGRWRIVAYETTGITPLAVTDRNESVTLSGVGTVAGRVNGLMTIREDRVAFASALLFDDHVHPDPAIDDYDAAMQVQGGAAPGTLADASFTLSGSSIRYDWTRQPDGTIVAVDADGARTTWAPVETLPRADALLTEGQVAVFEADDAMPLEDPRVMVAWDLPGGPESVMTHDTAISIVSGYAWFPLTVAAAPAEAVVVVEGVEVAVGHLLVYDDIDGDEGFTAGTDLRRGGSPIGIAYSSASTPDALLGTRYSELLPGFQFVHFHDDFSYGGGVGLAPFDPTVFVAPDLIVDVAPRSEPLPDVVP